ncbi:hypothetical protein [Salinisphaera sp. C84B14]|uniref:hypothetical protein n=1 Tax=Salinisphaera sp. C84B14 TaxID=1304155 RepID=UPI00334200C1
MKTSINYFAMALAVAAGVYVGNLATDFTRLWVTTSMLSKAIGEGPSFTVNAPPGSAVTAGRDYREQVARESRQQTAHEQRQRSDQMLEQRKTSPDGRRLYVQCDMWQRNSDKTPTDTTRRYADFYCRQYRQYLNTGVITNDKPRS